MPLLVDAARLIWKLPVDGIVCVAAMVVPVPADGGTTMLGSAVGQGAVPDIAEG